VTPAIQSNAVRAAAARVASRVRRSLFARECLVWLGRGFAVAGIAALLARALFDVDAARASLALVPIGLVPLLAWKRARDRAPSADAALVWLDVHSGGSGGLVTAAERAGPAGDAFERDALDRLAAVPAPASTSTGRQRLAPLAALLFAGACLVVPVGADELDGPELRPASEVHGTELERLREALTALEERVELEPERRAELGERLTALEQELADQSAGELALEGLDRMAEELAREAERAEAEAARALERLSDAAEGLPGSSSEAAESIEEALAELEQAGLLGALSPELSDELRELAEKLAEGLDGSDGIESAKGVEELMERLAELAALREELARELAKLMEELGEQGLATSPGALPPVELSADELRALIEALKEAQLDPQQCELARGGGT
jgi:uncharacterized protein Yka (UPF0111/DUF47 family)